MSTYVIDLDDAQALADSLFRHAEFEGKENLANFAAIAKMLIAEARAGRQARDHVRAARAEVRKRLDDGSFRPASVAQAMRGVDTDLDIAIAVTFDPAGELYRRNRTETAS